MADPLPCPEQVILAVEAALAAVPGGLTLDGKPVKVVRTLDHQDLPRIEIHQSGLVSDNGTSWSGVEVWTLTVSFALYVTQPVDPAPADRAAAQEAARRGAAAAGNALRAKLHKALMADPTFGGLVQDLGTDADPPPDLLAVFAADPAAAHVATYTLQFDTAEGDPFTFAD